MACTRFKEILSEAAESKSFLVKLFHKSSVLIQATVQKQRAAEASFVEKKANKHKVKNRDMLGGTE